MEAVVRDFLPKTNVANSLQDSAFPLPESLALSAFSVKSSLYSAAKRCRLNFPELHSVNATENNSKIIADLLDYCKRNGFSNSSADSVVTIWGNCWVLDIDSTTLKATLSGTEPLSTYSDYISGLFLSNALLEIKSTIQYFSVLDAIQPSTETDIWNILSIIKKHFSTTIPYTKLDTHDFGLSFDLNPPVPQNLRDPEADTYCLLKLAKAKSVIRYQFGNEVVNVGAALILEFSKTIPVTMALKSEIYSVPGVMRFDEFVRGSPTLNGNGVNHANHEINLDELMILNSTQNRFVDSLGTLAIEYKLRAEAVPAASINHIICLSVDAVSKVLEIIRRQVYFNSLFTVFNHSISEQTPNFFVEVTNWAPSTALTLLLTPSIALNERFTPISVIANIEVEGDMIKAIVRSDDGREMASESEILSGFLQKTWDLSGVAVLIYNLVWS